MASQPALQFPCDISALTTPALLVDLCKVRGNCEMMLRKAEAAGVGMRVHVKTHKIPQIAEMQVGGDKSKGVVASTVPEVALFAAAGFSDVTYGVCVHASKLPALARVAESSKARVSLLFDSEVNLDETEAFLAQNPGARFGAFLKTDTGYHRAGVDVVRDPARGVALATRLSAAASLDFRGIYSHSGHAYAASSREEAAAISDQECRAAAAFAQRLADAGVACPVISVGSTPACAAADKFPGVTEIHPGNYTFYDRQQVAVGGCQEGDVGVTVLTRVIGHYGSHMLCDTGSLAVSKDVAPQDQAFGAVAGHALLLQSVSQEVGKLVVAGTMAAPNPADYPVGTLLQIVPNHSCLTAACHPVYYVVEDGKVIDAWHPCRGW